VSPVLRDAAAAAGISVPPEPQPKEPTYAALAESQRQALMRDPQWTAKYQAGDVNAKRTFEALHRIILAKDAPEDELSELAQAAGIAKPLPLPPAPPPRNPLEHTDAKPADYRVNIAAPLPPEQAQAVTESAREWAAQMKFLPLMGNSVLDRIASVEPKLCAMTRREDLANWVDAQDRALVEHAGSVEAAKALIADARKAFTELGAGTAWAKQPDQPVLRDAWLTRTLANVWRAHAAARAR
jgi:hypothetical protein